MQSGTAGDVGPIPTPATKFYTKRKQNDTKRKHTNRQVLP